MVGDNVKPLRTTKSPCPYGCGEWRSPCADPDYDPWKRHDEECPAYANRVMIRLLRAVADGLAAGTLDGPVAVVMDRSEDGEPVPYVATQEAWVPQVRVILTGTVDVVGYEDHEA